MFGVGFLIKLLAPKIGERWAKPLAGLIVWGLILAVLAFLLYRAVDSYGDGRAREARDAERAAWVAAGEQLKEDAKKSATQADDAAVKRLAEHMEQSDADRKAIDQAVRDDTSPLDALFGN